MNHVTLNYMTYIIKTTKINKLKTVKITFTSETTIKNYHRFYYIKGIILIMLYRHMR